MFCSCCVAVIAFLYAFFDVNYFLRIFFTVGMGRLFEKKKKIFDETTIHGICFTQDVDFLFKHMNNARYLRDLDFARLHYFDRSGLYSALSAKGAGAVLGSSTIRYRRPISIFSPYKVVTKMLYWDDKNFYLEQRFVTLTDNFVRAIVLIKQSITNLKVPLADIIEKVEPDVKKPEVTKELRLWMESMEESSQKLKKEK